MSFHSDMEPEAIEEDSPLQVQISEQQQNDPQLSEGGNQSSPISMEETITLLRKQIYHLEIRTREAIQEKNSLLKRATELEASLSNTELEYRKKLDEDASKNEELTKEVSFLKNLVERVESELENVGSRDGSLMKILNLTSPVKESLQRILQGLGDDEKDPKLELIAEGEEEGMELEVEEMRYLSDLRKLAREAETKVEKFKETKEKEKRELQRSVESLTEEIRDTNALFRAALMEKEAVEKRMKEGNPDQKKAALMQIYERGLRGVGFGFMIGGGEQDTVGSSTPPRSSAASTKSEASDNEEEGDNLGSIVEKMMKNLRSEILQLRTALAESRSDNERMQTLAQKQAHELAATMEYVSELEERETALLQSIDGLESEIKEAEAEIARWREACESEVKAGKGEIEEREKVASILKGELEKTKAALEIANGRLRLKEELAEAAVAAQEAAERSLQLADGRSAELRQRIEVLTKEMEGVENRGRRLHWTSQICLPWRILRYASDVDTNPLIKSTRRLPPLLQGTT